MSSAPPVPAGMRLTADPDTVSRDRGRLLMGGSPRRLLRLTDAGAALATRLLDGAPVEGARAAALARRLLDAGLAHPCRPETSPDGTGLPAIEVVVPAYGAAWLDDCLRALAGGPPVTVVDDGSPDAESVAAVVAAHGARLVVRDRNGGPAAARNTGLAATTADVVAFVDSDAVVTPEALARLSVLLHDPAVAAAAPRIRPVPSGGANLRRAQVRACPLDLGERRAPVRPGGRVGYVPATVLVVRRAAVSSANGFDPALRVGEDVDLVWRMVQAGWSVRYEPSVLAGHHEPATWTRWLDRNRRYGGSVGPLATRHPAALAAPPAVMVAALALSAAGRPRAGGLALLAGFGSGVRRLQRAGLPLDAAAPQAAVATGHALLHTARWLAQLWWPLLLERAGRARRGRLPAALVLAGPALLRGRESAVGALADDVAYGAGVWTGCARARQWRPLLPRTSAFTAATSRRNRAAAG